MSIAKKYGQLLKKARQSLAYWTQIAKRDFTDDLLRWMEQRDVSQARLAELVDVSPQFITKVLRTNANLTIETMTKLGMALGCQLRIHLAERNAVTEWRDRPSDITRYTVPLGANVALLDSARFKAVVRGSEKPATIALAVDG